MEGYTEVQELAEKLLFAIKEDKSDTKRMVFYYQIQQKGWEFLELVRRYYADELPKDE